MPRTKSEKIAIMQYVAKSAKIVGDAQKKNC